MKSLPSKLLLILGLANYIFSFAFRNTYDSYTADTDETKEDLSTINLHVENPCTIPGSSIIAIYCTFIVIASGSLVLTLFTSACLWKTFNTLPFVFCPMKVVWCKKKWHKIPTDFSRYQDELDFEENIDVEDAGDDEEEC